MRIKLYSLFLGMSILTAFWMAWELEVFTPRIGQASDRKESPDVERLIKSLKDREAALEKRETELTSKTQSLQEREKIFSEQLKEKNPTATKDPVWDVESARYEKIIADWKAKYEAAEKAIQEKEAKIKESQEKVVAEGKTAAGVASEKEKLQETVQKLQKEIAQYKSVFEKFWPPQAESVRQIYEKMDPKRASAIFAEMDSKVSAYVLSTLKPSVTAEIIAKMAPDKATKITELLVSKRPERVPAESAPAVATP